MKYDVVSHAKKVNSMSASLSEMARQLGPKAFADSYRNGPQHLTSLLDDGPSKLTEASRQALRVYYGAQEYMDAKRQLALNLLTSPKLATLTTTDSVAASVIRAIGLNQPLPADRILQPIVADASKQFDDYEMEFSYLDDSQLQDLSWDEFHRWYSTSGYIHGQIVTRCLISPVTLPPALPKILDEVRMCYAFGQMAAIYGLCRGLVETAITDVCVRIGALTKAQLEDDYFFRDFPPHRRINWTLRGSEKSEAFALYTATSRVIHGSKAPEDTASIVRRSIALVERLYSRHAHPLASNRNA